MAKPLMSDAELRRRKKLQGKISQTTGALGLGALGATMVASRGGRNTLRRIPQLKGVLKKPPPKDPDRDRIKGGITPVLATSAGLGGLGAFNFAAYTNAESRKRQTMAKKPIKKSKGPSSAVDEMAPTFGEVAKAWTPQTTPYDPEKKRIKRGEIAQGAVYGAGGGLLGAAAVDAGKAGNYKRKAKEGLKAPAKLKAMDEAPMAARPPSDKKYRAAEKSIKQMARHHKLAGRHIRTSGKLAAVGAATVGAGEVIRRKRKSESWQPYAKRDTVSAFGVDHRLDE